MSREPLSSENRYHQALGRSGGDPASPPPRRRPKAVRVRVEGASGDVLPPVLPRSLTADEVALVNTFREMNEIEREHRR